MITTPRHPFGKQSLRRAFTLVEVLVAASISLVFLALLFGIVALSLRVVYKNVSLQDATTSTRLVQEYLSREVSQAVRVPDFVNESGTGSNNYSEIRYRVLIGPTAKVVADTLKSSTTVVLACPGDLYPKAGDFLMVSTPDFGANGGRIVQVDDPRTGGMAGNVTVTLTASIASLTTSTALQSDIKANSAVSIQRERAFRVNPPDSGASVCTLEWLETTLSYTPASGSDPATSFAPSGMPLCTKVDAANRFLFSREPAVSTATEEPALIWHMNYLSDQSSKLLGVFSSTMGSLVGGSSETYMASHSEGLIMPKSFNPLGTGGINFKLDSTSSTTSTSTTSTTSTSISTTTTSTTSTTKTTTTKTTTTKTTSTKTTSTTSISTTSTSTTSKSTTSTTSTSTTSKSTTSTSTTSTTKTTTTKTTSTSTTSSVSTTTTSTTSKPTTTTTTSIIIDG